MAGLGLNEKEVAEVEERVRSIAWGVVKQRVVEAANTVGSRIKER